MLSMIYLAFKTDAPKDERSTFEHRFTFFLVSLLWMKEKQNGQVGACDTCSGFHYFSGKLRLPIVPLWSRPGLSSSMT
jgi:hypothetical protein